MDNIEYQTVGLYNHNADSYNKIKSALESGEDVVGIVHATGTGKTFNALQLAYDNKSKKIVYVVPSKGIIEHIKKIINDNPNLYLERDFPNLVFKTYQSFINLDTDEIEAIDCDLLILDEFHHIGAPVWGARINTMIDTHPNIKIFGMTAYTVRDRGTAYERDMANPATEELFSRKVVSRYDLCDAMIDGVLPKPIYKSAQTNLLGLEQSLEEKVANLNVNSKEYQEYISILEAAKRRIHEAPSISKLLKKTIKPDGKYIYFCPPCSEDGANDIETIKNQAIEWFKQFVPEEDIVIYTSTSDMGEEGRKNRDAFYDDKDLEGNNTNNKLRIMFAINQYNEGIHAPNVDGVIMGRGTSSDIVYYEQLGRALAVRGKTKERIEKLEQYTTEELLMICKERDIPIKEETSKEEIIEKLVAPIIIDLTNNYEFIKELENNLKDRIKEYQENHEHQKRNIKIRDASFDIEIEDQDLFEMLKSIRVEVDKTWEEMYEYAKQYYEKHGNLEVPYTFITVNGYDYDSKGNIKLGMWISGQKYKTDPISERGKQLSQIGMRFERKKMLWKEMYEYAKTYYEHHGNLNVTRRFKTNNGYDYDEKGQIKLGAWISGQRTWASPESERGQLLSQIGMRFERKKLLWEEMYEYAKAYYEHHGNLEVPRSFKTKNGYEYDEEGQIKLGIWISNQRIKISPESEKGQMLSQIGMRFETRKTMSWEEMYEYAKAYYEHHSNLEVPKSFKTKNGYEYDEEGPIGLGMWISSQRGYISPESERGQLLLQIGMRFERKYLLWEGMYEYAKAYFEHHGNLNAPRSFKTKNGYEYDEEGPIKLGKWISDQRTFVSPESERGQLLSQIGMRFETRKTMSWEGMYEYAKAYYEHHSNLEVPQKFKTKNGYEYDEKGPIGLGTWIYDQRRKISPESEKGQMLSQIGMRFERINLSWEEMYEYAKLYYEHHGNLEVPRSFKTKNGYDYDENGQIGLGVWISNQRRDIQPDSERVQLLSQIGMRLEIKKIMSWEEMYEYAKLYYEHHGNLEVPQKFKTNNGYDYDENGQIGLGGWISNQRRHTQPDSERVQLLSQIGMRFERKILLWEEMYEYAKLYYEHHGNLEVPQRFKTNNGYDYDENGQIGLGGWISNQRRHIQPDSEQGQLLSQIGMRWNIKSSDSNKKGIESMLNESSIEQEASEISNNKINM